MELPFSTLVEESIFESAATRHSPSCFGVAGEKTLPIIKSAEALTKAAGVPISSQYELSK